MTALGHPEGAFPHPRASLLLLDEQIAELFKKATTVAQADRGTPMGCPPAATSVVAFE
jgi:hypothetical protein